MVQINFARKEINCKLVYYGPGVSGKTTNLEMVHERTPDANRGELTSISTDGDRTLFFDFMPLDLGEIAGMKTKFHLYTVPGQVYYNSTRKLVLLGADGVIFVADSSRAKLEENRASLDNLRENLAEMGKNLAKFPVILQWNKRDLPDAMPVEELEQELNGIGAPSFEAIACQGVGVFETLKELSAKVLASINSSQPARRPKKPAEEPPARPVISQDDQQIGATISEGEAPPPLGGFQIERNEIQLEPVAPGTAETAGTAARPPAKAPHPRVASNPLEEMGVIASKAAPRQASRTATLDRPQSRRTDSNSAPETEAGAETCTELSEMMARRAPEHARAEPEVESFRRNVRVIGGRPGGVYRRRQDGRAVAIAVACTGSLLAAAAIYYYLFVV